MVAVQPVLRQPLVHQRDDLVQRVRLESQLTVDVTDQEIDPLDMLGAAKKLKSVTYRGNVFEVVP